MKDKTPHQDSGHFSLKFDWSKEEECFEVDAIKKKIDNEQKSDTREEMHEKESDDEWDSESELWYERDFMHDVWWLNALCVSCKMAIERRLEGM